MTSSSRQILSFDILALKALCSKWLSEPTDRCRRRRVAEADFTHTRRPNTSLPGSNEVCISHRGLNNLGVWLSQFRRHYTTISGSYYEVSTSRRLADDLFLCQLGFDKSQCIGG